MVWRLDYFVNQTSFFSYGREGDVNQIVFKIIVTLELSGLFQK